jgi:hypothetical protein
MSDDKFEEFLKREAQAYNAPPPTPREEIWAAIDVARRIDPSRRTGPRIPQWLAWGVGIAALLVLSFALGRMSGGFGAPVTEPPLAQAPDTATSGTNLVYEVAATDYLQRIDAFLMLFRSEAQAGRADAEVGEWARDLLSMARLMMDSPAGDDPQLRGLFEDLEVILVQITQYTSQQDETELEMIQEGLDTREVIVRLRAQLTGAAPVQGAL